MKDHLNCMKKFILYLFLAFSISQAFAQDGIHLQIKHDKQVIFSATNEDEQKNIVTLSSSGFHKNSCYHIFYNEENTVSSKGKWIRTIAFYDEKDNELLKKQTANLKIEDAELNKLLLANKTIKIYTWSLPKDPAEAARIRIRRVHLCTIVLGD